VCCVKGEVICDTLDMWRERLRDVCAAGVPAKLLVCDVGVALLLESCLTGTGRLESTRRGREVAGIELLVALFVVLWAGWLDRDMAKVTDI
jgi:hypothetical protein